MPRERGDDAATRAVFDRAYFDRWYRDPRHQVKSAVELKRQVALAVAAAEWVLDRPIRSVLDVGAGEGHWRAPLRALRRGVAYTGIDPSPYVVRRFGRRRHILLGGFGDVGSMGLRSPFDLVVCCGVVQFLSRDEFLRGLPALAALSGGLLHLEIFTAEDDIEGDQRGERQPTAWYRRALDRAGLVPCGLHNYVHRRTAKGLSTMEAMQ
jgi:SAM-dependent methyltransferase